jgi:hypothetical protein
MVSWYGVDTYVNYKLLALIILVCDLVLLGMMIGVLFGLLVLCWYHLGLNLVVS